MNNFGKIEINLFKTISGESFPKAKMRNLYILAGFASILPIIGTGLIWLPIAIYELAQGNTWQGITLILWGILFLGTIDNVIRLLLARKIADVHPIVSVLGVIMGLQYFGITGLIFGPLIISYFIIFLKMYYMEYQKKLTLK